MGWKKCQQCGATKTTEEFYRKKDTVNEYYPQCKECGRAAKRVYSAKNRDQILAYAKRYYAKNKEKCLAATRKYQAEHPEQIRAHQKKWYGKNKHKKAAQQRVFKALKSGKLKKENCKVCGSSENIQAHHPDYSRPLEVVWLCHTHHQKNHVKTRKSANW